MIDAEAKQKIINLQKQIDVIYQEVKRRPSNMTCDICGSGDLTAKNGIVFKVKHQVHGYVNRPEHSPKLCHKHASGWALSHDAYNPLGTRGDEEVDLHFTQYLAKQLMKASKK